MDQILDDMRKAVQVATAHMRVVALNNHASPDAMYNAARDLVAANQNLTLARASFYGKAPLPTTSRPVDPSHDGRPKTPTPAKLGHALMVEDGCDPNCLIETMFTPGPYVIDEAGTVDQAVPHPDWTAIGVTDGDGVSEVVAYCAPANAPLLSSAPDLFAACQAAYVRLLSLGQYRGRVRMAGQRELSDLRDALAKAVDARAVDIQDSAEHLASLLRTKETSGAPSREEQDAHLRDAAPDMYAAGRAVVASWEKGDLAGAVRALAAALVRADGGTP